ncbi:MAG: hypothetical protein WCM93_14420 [Bacteroidota bacterium]
MKISNFIRMFLLRQRMKRHIKLNIRLLAEIKQAKEELAQIRAERIQREEELTQAKADHTLALEAYNQAKNVHDKIQVQLAEFRKKNGILEE